MKGLSDGSFFRFSGERKEDVLTKGKNPYGIAMLMGFLYRFSQVTQPRIGKWQEAWSTVRPIRRYTGLEKGWSKTGNRRYLKNSKENWMICQD